MFKEEICMNLPIIFNIENWSNKTETAYFFTDWVKNSPKLHFSSGNPDFLEGEDLINLISKRLKDTIKKIRVIATNIDKYDLATMRFTSYGRNIEGQSVICPNAPFGYHMSPEQFQSNIVDVVCKFNFDGLDSYLSIDIPARKTIYFYLFKGAYYAIGDTVPKTNNKNPFLVYFAENKTDRAAWFDFNIRECKIEGFKLFVNKGEAKTKLKLNGKIIDTKKFFVKGSTKSPFSDKKSLRIKKHQQKWIVEGKISKNLTKAQIFLQPQQKAMIIFE